MSKGTKIVCVRLGDELLRQVEEDIERKFLCSSGEPLNVSTWIRKAVEEKLKHGLRSRRPKRRKPSKAGV